MNSIVLFVDKKGWQPDVWGATVEGTVTDGGQFVVETSNSWISIYKCDDVFSDYDSDEKQIVKSSIDDPVPYLIEWRGDDLLEKFVEDFPSSIKAVVDNDHGLICNISELKGLSVSYWFRAKKITCKAVRCNR